MIYSKVGCCKSYQKVRPHHALGATKIVDIHETWEYLYYLYSVGLC